MKLKPFAEIIAMTKEGLDAALAPIRAKQVKMKAELEMAKIDEQLINTETKIQELCTTKDINFDSLITKLDEYALAERRKKQFQKIINELFPS